MLKISKSSSSVISLVLAAALIVAFGLIMVFLPIIAESGPVLSYLAKMFAEKDLFGMGRASFFIFGYVVLAIAEACCISVLLLLLRVRKGLVFTEITVSLIRFVSWGSIAMGAVFLAAQYFNDLSFVLALAFFFLGLCLRAVKNAFEEAIAIKKENDLTV